MSGSNSKPRERKNKKKNNNNNNNRDEAKQEPVVLMLSSSSSDSEDPNGVDEEAKSSNNSNPHVNDESLLEDRKDKSFSTGTGCCFPTNRIKRIIRSEGADFRATQETIFLINKATEQFLELFCEDAYACTRQDRQKAVAYKHLSSVVCKGRRYDFLSDFVPEKVRAEDALSERLAET